MSNFYGELLIRITSDTAGLSRGLQQSAAQTNAASKAMEASGKKAKVSWERVGLGMQNVGRTMSQFVTLPIVAGFAYATYAGYKYSKSLLQIQNLTGLNAAETERYGTAMLNMSKYGVGPQKLAESMYFISSSGFKAAEAMKVLDVAAKASASGMGEVQPIADVLTSAMNAYGHSNLSAARATDILMKTIEVGKAEPQALATSLGRIMPVAAKLGVPLGQVGGAVAGLTLTGLSAAEAVTSLRGTMIALSAPAKMSIDELKTLGLSYQDVTRSIKEKGLLATMQMLYEKTDGNMLSMRKIIPNVRALNGLLSLLGPNYKRNVEITKEVIDSNGKLAESFATTAKTPLQKFRVAIADIQSSFIKMGIQIMPMVATITSKIGGMFDAIGNLDPGYRGAIMWAGAFVAALGPIVMIAGSVIRSVALIKGALASLSIVKGLGAASTAFQVGGAAEGIAALTSALGPLGVALGAVTVAAAGFYVFTKARDWLDGTTERIGAMRKAAQEVAADDSLKSWADKYLGGHLEAKGKNAFVFKVAGKVEGDPNILANWVRTAKAKAAAAAQETNQQSLIDVTLGDISHWKQRVHELESLPMPKTDLGKPNVPVLLARRREIDAYNQKIGVSTQMLRSLGVEMVSLKNKDKGLILFAQFKDYGAAISKQTQKVKGLKAELAKKPKDVQLGIRTDRAERNLALLKAARDKFVADHRQAIIDVQIGNAKSRLSEVNGILKKLNSMKSTPEVRAQIKAFMAERARVIARLRELNGMRATPTVNANVGSALSSIGQVIAAMGGIHDRTVSITVNRRDGGAGRIAVAAGGIHDLTGPTNFLAGEAGREIAAFFPLNDPNRSAALLGQLNTILGARGGSSPAAVGAGAGGVGSPVLIQNDIHLDSNLIASSVLNLADTFEAQSSRGNA